MPPEDEESLEKRVDSLEGKFDTHCKLVEQNGKTLNLELKRIGNKMDQMVLQVEFRPVQAAVFGLIGLTLATVFGAVIASVIVKG